MCAHRLSRWRPNWLAGQVTGWQVRLTCRLAECRDWKIGSGKRINCILQRVLSAHWLHTGWQPLEPHSEPFGDHLEVKWHFVCLITLTIMATWWGAKKLIKLTSSLVKFPGTRWKWDHCDYWPADCAERPLWWSSMAVASLILLLSKGQYFTLLNLQWNIVQRAPAKPSGLGALYALDL